MTDEGTSETEAWIGALEGRYAYGYDKKRKLYDALGVNGIPRAILVSPAGTIVWEGHPMAVDANLINAHLTNALTLPLYEWPRSAKGIKDAYLKGNFGKAISKAKQLAVREPFALDLERFLLGVVGARAVGMESGLERGDILFAQRMAEGLIKGGVKGLPEEQRARAVLKKISEDKQLKGWLETQEKYEELMAERLRRREKDCEERIKQLRKLLKGNEGSYIGGRIESSIGQVQQYLAEL